MWWVRMRMRAMTPHFARVTRVWHRSWFQLARETLRLFVAIGREKKLFHNGWTGIDGVSTSRKSIITSFIRWIWISTIGSSHLFGRMPLSPAWSLTGYCLTFFRCLTARTRRTCQADFSFRAYHWFACSVIIWSTNCLNIWWFRSRFLPPQIMITFPRSFHTVPL